LEDDYQCELAVRFELNHDKISDVRFAFGGHARHTDLARKTADSLLVGKSINDEQALMQAMRI